jgi:phosphatidylserine/phosphatidylglycerophosphate/cardiolipin synthase-like enzyme
MLSPDGDMVRALDAACDRGVRVDVQLDRAPFAYAVTANAQSMMQLQSHRCGARYARGNVHLKVALLDHTMYLSDRNFTADGLFLRDSLPDDRQAVLTTLSGGNGQTEHFWTRKSDALNAEAAFIATATQTLFVETESFGFGNVVFDAIRERAASRVAVYLLVAQTEYDQQSSERSAVAYLAKYGVVIRLSDANAKLAVPDADGAWIGSANATGGVPEQTDWGMLLPGNSAAVSVAERFHADWQRSTPAY